MNKLDPLELPTATDFLCLKWLGYDLTLTMTKSKCSVQEMISY